MAIKSCFRVVFLSSLLFASSAMAQSVRDQMKDPNFHVYNVVFGLTIDRDSKLQAFRVVKVVEPSSGSNAAVNISVPQGYVNAVKERVVAMHYPPTLKNGKPVEVFTDFMFTPGHPDAIITDIYKPIDPKQH